MYMPQPNEIIVISQHAFDKLDRARHDRAITLRNIDMASQRIAADSADAGWYCLSVMSGHEFAVEKRLADADVLALVPRRKGKEIRNRGRVLPAKDVPVMTGYVLVRILRSIAAFQGLRSIDGVTGVVGGMEKPFRVNDRIVSRFKRLAEEGQYDYQTIDVRFSVGDVVLITDGPFAKFPAVVLDIAELKRGRILVEVMIFGRPTKADLVLAQIEKL